MKFFTQWFYLLVFSLVMPAAVLAESPDEKRALATRVLELWHVENSAIALFQQTGVEVLQKTGTAISVRLPRDKRETVLTAVTGDVQAYIEQLLPYVTETAQSVKQTVFMPFLMENFDQQELADLVRILESPAKKKLDELLPAVQGEYESKVVAVSSSRIRPALTELTTRINGQLQQAAESP